MPAQQVVRQWKGRESNGAEHLHVECPTVALLDALHLPMRANTPNWRPQLPGQLYRKVYTLNFLCVLHLLWEC